MALVKTVRLNIITDPGDSKLKLDQITAKADDLGKMHPEIKVKIDSAAAQLKLAVIREELKSIGSGPESGTSGLTGWLGNLKNALGGIIGSSATGAAGAGGSGLLGITATLPLVGTLGVPAMAALAVAAGAAVLALTPVAAALIPVTLGFGTLAAVAGPGVIGVFKTLGMQGDKLKKAMAALTPEERAMVREAQPLKDQFHALQKSIQPQIVKAFGEGLKVLKELMPALGPLVRAAAKSLGAFLDNMADWLASPSGKSFVNWLRTVGPRDIKNFGRVMWDIARAVGDALHAMYVAGSWIDRLVTHWQDDWAIIKLSAKIALDWVALAFLGTVKTVVGFAADIPGPWQGAFRHMRDAIGGEMTRIVGDVRNSTRQIGDAWQAIHGKTVPLNFDLNLPAGIGITGPGGQKTQHHAAGTAGAAPGLAWVGEEGPELVNFHGGEQVFSARMSEMIARGYAAGTENFTDKFTPGVSAFTAQMTAAAAAAENVIARAVQAHASITGSLFGTGGLGSGPGGPVEAVARALFPWPASQWPSFNYVEMREAGYALTARNATSGAYGVAQFINGPSEYYQWGGNPFSAAGQFTAMFNYIRCMPLDTEILTRRGWLTHDEVAEGDETIACDPLTGEGRWTKITAVHHYEQAPLVHMRSQRFDVRCTPNHRWLTEKLIQHPDGNYRRTGFTETRHLGTRHRIRLAVQHTDSPGLPLSLAEAELLGWIAGDGSISRYRPRKPESTYRPTGKGLFRRFRLDQSKPERIAEIDALVEGMPFSRHVYAPRPGSWGRLPKVTWMFGAKFSVDLMERSGYECDREAMVLAMSPEQREAFLRGLMGADGHQPPGDCNAVLAQNEGATLDAAVLAMYLSGHYPHLTDSAGQKHVTMGKAAVKGGMRTNDDDIAPVWCVTTELGTWTARQSGQIFLTGNSRYGTPSAAAQHEAFFNWYDTGGVLQPGANYMWNGTGRPEALVPAGRGGPVYNIHVSVAPGGEREAGRQIVHAIQAYEQGSGTAWRKGR